MKTPASKRSSRIFALSLGPILLGSSLAQADTSFWQTKCVRAEINKQFKMNSKTFEYQPHNCSAAIDSKILELLNNGPKYKYIFLDKTAKNCTAFYQGKSGNIFPGENSETAVCVDRSLTFYSVDFKGKKEELIKKLTEKYGSTVKTLKYQPFENTESTYSLLSNADVSYVVLRETKHTPAFGEPETTFRVTYINRKAHDQLSRLYSSATAAEAMEKTKQQELDTKQGLEKLR